MLKFFLSGSFLALSIHENNLYEMVTYPIDHYTTDIPAQCTATRHATLYGRPVCSEDQFVARFPQWGVYSRETRQEIRNMFDQSKQKYAWFPDYYLKPERGKATIRPRYSLHREYLKKGGRP